MMNRLLFGLALVMSAAGCHKAPPPLAGGKPLTHWLEALHSPDPQVRREAVFKLGNVGMADAKAFPAVTEALHDADATVRREAVLALMKFGPQAATALPSLTHLRQEDPNPEVRAYAARALERLQGG